MTLTETINHYESLQHTYERNAISKTYYNPYAAETDRQTALEYKQHVGWLKGLNRIKEVMGEVENGTIPKSIAIDIIADIINAEEMKEEVTMNDNS
jgi:hypothetical protein